MTPREAGRPGFATPVDVGLQPERTFLAWTRTACALAVVGLLGIRWVSQFGALSVLICLGPALVLGLVLATSRLRVARLAGALLNSPVRKSAGHRPELAVVVTVAGVLAVGMLSIVAVIRT